MLHNYVVGDDAVQEVYEVVLGNCKRAQKGEMECVVRNIKVIENTTVRVENSYRAVNCVAG